jgi:hypothetical protein
MDAIKYSPAVDRTIMKSHYETYKGWKILVEISGSSFIDDVNVNACCYIPRIVATEQLSIGFRELEVPATIAYPTPERCIYGGITMARKFIDDRG